VQTVSKSFGPVRACASATPCKRFQHHAALCWLAWLLPYAGPTRKFVWPCEGLLVCRPVQAFPTSRGPVRARSLAALCRLNKRNCLALCGHARLLPCADVSNITRPCAGALARCPMQAQQGEVIGPVRACSSAALCRCFQVARHCSKRGPSVPRWAAEGGSTPCIPIPVGGTAWLDPFPFRQAGGTALLDPRRPSPGRRFVAARPPAVSVGTTV